MNKIQHIRLFLAHEFKIEWRNKHALNGILLYVVGSVFICYLSFNVKSGLINPATWNALFWIIILFSAINAVSKSFTNQTEGQNLYLYSLIHPVDLIISKMVYNFCLLLFLAVLGLCFYSLVMANPVQDLVLYMIAILLASFGFASCLTLVSAIASKAGRNGTLMTILSFPIVLPILLLVIKLTKNAMDGLDWSVSYDEITILIAINSITIVLSSILFPFLWKN